MWIKVTDMAGKLHLLNMSGATRVCTIPGKGTRVYFTKAGETSPQWDFSDVKEDLTHFIDALASRKEPEDAPPQYDADQARCWANGWNGAVRAMTEIMRSR